MENFQLRQGSSRKTANMTAFRNLSNNTCRSFISTALGSDSVIGGQDLRKSRIQNLPNYKKSSLGNDVNFIVVFQTIEIQRLSNQVQLLRVRLRENERQLFNAQNYQVQIRQLTEKCFTYQQDKQLYTQEIQKLNRIAQNLYNQNENLKQNLDQMSFGYEQKFNAEKQKNSQLSQEVERWKNRAQSIQKNKTKDMDELKSLMENQRKSTVEREIKEISIRHQNQKSNLQNQIRKCRELLNNKNSQIQDLKKSFSKYQNYKQQISQYKNKAIDADNKLQLANSELRKITDLLKAKDLEIDNTKRNHSNLSNKLKDQAQMENQYKSLKNLVDNKTKQLEQFKVKYSKCQQETLRGKEMIHVVNQLQDKLKLTTTEINRLSVLLKNKTDEIQKAKNKQIEKDNEISRLRNLENEMAQHDSRYNMMKAENQRVNSILKMRLDEIQNWKKKYGQLQSVSTRFSLIERDKKALQQKYNVQLKTGQQLKFLITKLEAQRSQLQKYQKLFVDETNKCNLLMKQLDRLNSIIKANSQDLTSSKFKYTKLQESLRDYKDKLQYIKDYENKIHLLSEQNKRLNNLIQNRNEDIQSLEQSRVDMLTKINHYKNYQIKINDYENIIKKLNQNVEFLKRQLENSQGKIRNYDNKFREMENNLANSNQERQKLNGLNKNIKKELDDNKNKCSRLEQECKKKAQLDLVCQQLHGQVLVYLGQLEATERKYKQYEEAYNKEKKTNQEIFNKMGSMTTELEKLSKENNTKKAMRSQQMSELEEKVKGHLATVKGKDQQIQRLLEKIDKLERECGKLSKEFNKLAVIAQNNEKQTQALNIKIQQYKDYAKRIHILSSELDRLSTLNRSLQDDNKKMRLKYSDNISVEKKEQEMALRFLLMSVEIQSLRERADKRQINIDEMRKSILEPIRKI